MVAPPHLEEGPELLGPTCRSLVLPSPQVTRKILSGAGSLASFMGLPSSLIPVLFFKCIGLNYWHYKQLTHSCTTCF